MACLAGALGLFSSCVAMPVASMASCLACQACTCLASSVCSCCCTSLFCSSKSEDIVSRSSRFIYLFLFVAATVVAGVLRDQSQVFVDAVSKSDIFSVNMQCPASDTSKDCVARALVLRICFGTFVFHVILALLTVGAKDYSNPRVLIHTGLWPIKFIVWAGLHVATFFIPTTFFLGFKWAVLVLAVIFLIMQTIIFIEWIFELNESWIKKDGVENLKGPYHILIIIISILALGGSLTITGFMFKWFGTDSDGNSGSCGLYNFFTAFNLILFIGLTLFSFRATSWMSSTGLLPSSLVAAFLTFKVLMALYAQNQCNQLSVKEGASYVSPQGVSALSIIIATVLAAYCSIVLSQDIGEDGMFWGPSSSENKSLPSTEPSVMSSPPATTNTQLDRAAPLLQNPHHVAVEMHPTGDSSASGIPELQGNNTPGTGQGNVVVAPSGPVGYSIAGFHVAFLLGICYVTMQLTDWNEDFSSAEHMSTVRNLDFSL
jgi:hypothetical protein